LKNKKHKGKTSKNRPDSLRRNDKGISTKSKCVKASLPLRTKNPKEERKAGSGRKVIRNGKFLNSKGTLMKQKNKGSGGTNRLRDQEK